MSFGDTMMLLRKKKGFSQAALGKLIGTSGDVVGRYERGDIKPSIDVVTRIADALEVSVDFLMGRTKLVMDKQAVKRLEEISSMPPEEKEHLYKVVDALIRDFKNKQAYS